MKKVLALVLAVIMVCTMAMAVQIGGTELATAGDATVNANYRFITPGQSIIFSLEDLDLEGNKAVLNKDNTFAPEKNKVDVDFEKGADLVASKGWAKVIENGTTTYKYVITTKASETAVLDDTADIIISKVTVTKYAIDGSKVYKFAKKTADGTMVYAFAQADHLGDLVKNIATPTENICDFTTINHDFEGWGKFYLVFNYGRPTATLYTTSSIPAASDTLYTVKKQNVGDDATMNVATTTEGGKIAYSLKAGEKVIFSAVPSYDLTKLTKALQSEIITNDVNVTGILGGAVVPNKAVKITVDKQKEGAALYMVNADGTLTNLGAKFDDNGVLTATAKITGAVILTDKAMTASNVITTPGTTTNPGTGANDVVGVAAALAVVALVSGAAISLKK